MFDAAVQSMSNARYPYFTCSVLGHVCQSVNVAPSGRPESLNDLYTEL